MTNKTIAILMIASGCGKGGGAEKATPETEAFIESLNDHGLIEKVHDAKSWFGNSLSEQGAKQCMYVGGTVERGNDLMKALVEMPKKVPGLTKCRAAILTTGEKVLSLISHDIPSTATCDQVPPIWATRATEMQTAHCRFRAAIDTCKAEAKIAGATTAFDEVMTGCFGADAEGVTPSEYEKSPLPSAAPKAPTP